MAKNIIFDNLGHATYELFINGQSQGLVSLNVTGIHNVYNSLAAIALSNIYIKDLNIIKEGLLSFTGVGRRFEFIGKYKNTNIYDDYAHHPSEIKTTLDSVKKTKHNKSYAIFQSHTYSRTYEHLIEFANILKNFDNIIIAPIYPARETNIYNVKEEQLVELIKKENENVWYIDSFDKIIDFIKEKVQDDDLVITIGAGPINEVAKKLALEE